MVRTCVPVCMRVHAGNVQACMLASSWQTKEACNAALKQWHLHHLKTCMVAVTNGRCKQCAWWLQCSMASPASLPLQEHLIKLHLHSCSKCCMTCE